MRTKRTIGAGAAILGILGAAGLGGCDIVVGIGIYCTEAKTPGCGGAGTGAGGGTGGSPHRRPAGRRALSVAAARAAVGQAVRRSAHLLVRRRDATTGLPQPRGLAPAQMECRHASKMGHGETCDGDVLPGVETCASTKDEDCNNTECAIWSEVFGDSATQAVLDIAVDSAGDILVFGFFLGELSGVQPPLTSVGSSDLFLLKVKPTGEMLWAKQWGDVNDQSHGKMALDSAGNIVIAGSYQVHGPSYVLPPKGADDIYVANGTPMVTRSGRGYWGPQGTERMGCRRGCPG